MIRKQVGDLSTHTTKYSSPALTQKVFANIRWVGKGFYGVETPLFEGMIVEQQVDEGAGEGADEVHDEGVPAAGIVAEGAVSTADDEVPTAVKEPSIPSPTPPPQPLQDQPSTFQVQLTPPQSPQAQPQSPQHQPQPSQDAGLPMDLLQNLIDTCTTLTRRVENLEQDKIAQALEITKLKYQAIKRKPQTEAQARKNMMVYLKNVAGFNMDYFKGMSYDDIRPIFEKYVDSNVAFLQNTKEQMDEKDSRALKRLNESKEEKAAKKEDLEALWSLVKERFATTKPKNFSDDFLLITLGAMFEKSDIHAQI
nr:hypothetical protein [Tanacetum cinerariifolium]